MKNKRITIICGHYGSGKSTFSLNYAINIRENTESPVSLADLDVINPYFRTREHKDMLLSKNIKILGSYIYDDGSDLPSISADVLSIFHNKNSVGIIDLGGSGAGVLPFANFRKYVEKDETEVLYVFNACREENETLKKTLDSIMEIEYFLDMKIDGIVNNTHLMNYTNEDVVEKGYELSKEVADKKAIYIKCNSFDDKIYKKMQTFLLHNIKLNDIFIMRCSIKTLQL